MINENRTLVTNDNYIRLINKVEAMDDRLTSIETKMLSKYIIPNMYL